MRNVVAILAIALCVFVLNAGGFDDAAVVADTLPVAQLPPVSADSILAQENDSVAVDKPVAAAGKGDIDAVDLDDEELLRAALAIDSVKVSEAPHKLALIRRDYEYKKQTRAAIVMMIFIAVAMATSQSWNPR